MTQAAADPRLLDGSVRDGARVACDHCGLAVPAGLIEPGAAQQFCCRGCRTAYELIHACGLEPFYRLRDRETDWQRLPAAGTGRRYDEFDDAAFAGLYVRESPQRLRQVELYLEGVHCAACVWLIERLPTVVAGVVEARLALHRSLVQVVWDPAQVALSRIARVLDALGYPPHPARSAAARAARTAEDRRWLWRIALAGALAGNVMLMAIALYAGMFDGIGRAEWTLFRYGSMVLGLVSLVGPGRVFFRGAWAALRTRTPHLDLPIAVGLGVGGAGGVYHTLTGIGEIYFDSLTVLIFLLLVGRFLQHRQQRRADDALELLFSLSPRRARRMEGETVQDVPVEALAAGDVVEVRAGESLPADGVVIAGGSSVDQSLLTGESLPVSVGVGQRLAAGTLNLEATLRVRVEATGRQTRVGQLMQLVEDCARRRAPIVQLADRIAAWFTGAVIFLAVMTFAIWRGLDADRALDQAVALLIVACPCALGLATPLALAVAIGRAAKRNILIKGGDTLERLTRPGVILLDKTGTLTVGRIQLQAWHGSEAVKPAVLAIERHSSHPIARAIAAALLDEGVVPVEGPIQVQQTAQGGIAATVDARAVLIGSLPFVQSQDVAVTQRDRAWIDACTHRGLSPVCVARDGVIEAVIGLGDALRQDAERAIMSLRAMGWTVGILSGDHPALVQRVARALQIDPAQAHGGLMPEEKLAMVEQHAARGTVVMVGDGVNDAAALAAATVGVAVHGGAEASLAASDVYLARPDLASLVELMQAARRTIGVVRRNLLASLGYNALAVSLAVAGAINPLIAAVLMPISSLTVLSLSLGARTFGSDR